MTGEPADRWWLVNPTDAAIGSTRDHRFAFAIERRDLDGNWIDLSAHGRCSSADAEVAAGARSQLHIADDECAWRVRATGSYRISVEYSINPQSTRDGSPGDSVRAEFDVVGIDAAQADVALAAIEERAQQGAHVSSLAQRLARRAPSPFLERLIASRALTSTERIDVLAAIVDTTLSDALLRRSIASNDADVALAAAVVLTRRRWFPDAIASAAGPLRAAVASAEPISPSVVAAVGAFVSEMRDRELGSRWLARAEFSSREELVATACSMLAGESLVETMRTLPRREIDVLIRRVRGSDPALRDLLRYAHRRLSGRSGFDPLPGGCELGDQSPEAIDDPRLAPLFDDSNAVSAVTR